MRSTHEGAAPRTAAPAFRRRAATAGAAAVLLVGTLAASPAHAEPGPPDHSRAPEHAGPPEHAGKPGKPGRDLPLSELVTADAVREHLENLDTIAEYNGGNRATNTPGYDVAALYVEDQLERAGYEPYRHEYEYELWREQSPAVLAQTSPEQVAYEADTDYVTMSYSGAGDVTAPAVGVNTDSTASGCSADDFADFPEGAVAITMRGTCPFADKVQNAADAGASAALVVNSSDEVFLGTVSELSDIPALGVSGTAGADLLATEGLELRVKVDAEVSNETSFSILAETPGGRDDNVVMVGSHLDSVAEGPGINDNGSGSSFVLETAIQLAKQEAPENKVRFAFWGTEEEGLVGSTRYVEDLTAEQVEDIGLYLNFDMIGSHNYARFVLDGGMELPGSVQAPSGSGAIAKVFSDYFASQDQVSEPGVLSGRSDYQAFMEAGIPSGGLFSGADGVKTEEQVQWYGGTAGEQFDPYYHTAEDTLDKINWDSVAELSAAGAHGVEFFSESTLPVNGVLRYSANDAGFPKVGDAWRM
ncbi:Zn-dependent M28 family amino/carboxypeptidase [Nocardiopsis arvandica]|uniref:Zn-dependent M28 family amino/carboxypeptidase n=1 Tax=Nocardiopsis sinuspersici TaxID=501010 RepID=A0A7Y9XDF9_9ACTN|nr:M28 family peptidase [Nocardiopsis sinuspersici]NYH53784.1 Zn-dependent M28 family amino/carboxypeptidase [Nocardiopsis sinuspersici]